MPTVYMALGSNLGDRAKALDEGVSRLVARVRGRLLARSANFETLAEGGPVGQPNFLNGAFTVQTAASAHDVLEAVAVVETEMGRPPIGQRPENGPRIIDLDILLYDTQVIHEPGLAIPHPRMHLRRFVLAPLAQIAPDARHPLLGATVAEMLGWLTGVGESQR